MYNLAFLGRAQSGKDTAAGFLVSEHSYTALAFADPLRSLVWDMNPYVPTVPGVTVRLRTLIADVGWDYAKLRYPEVRQLMQRVGQAMRERDPDYWVDDMRKRVNAGLMWNMPMVVSDVRYPNEADMLKRYGFKLVRIIRPGATAGGTAAQHASETALDDFETDFEISNAGSLEDFRWHVKTIADA